MPNYNYEKIREHYHSLTEIKKIFEDKVDDLVKKQFTRFSKGQFERALITIKKSKDLRKVMQK